MTDIANTEVPNLRTALQNVITALTNFKNNADENSMNYVGGPNAIEQAQAVTDLKSTLDTIIASINTILSVSAPVGQLQSISNQATTIATSINTALTDANTLKALVTTLETQYNNAVTALNTFGASAQANVTAAIPQAKAQILTDIGAQQTLLFSKFECRDVANDFMNARQGLCGNIVSSLDAFWSSFAIMALWSLASLPITVYVANKLFLDLTKFQDAAADPEFKEKSEEKSKESSSFGKALGAAASAFQPVLFFN